MSHLSKFFRERRLEKGLSLGQVARLLGYTNLSRGANRIQSLERGDKVRPDFLGRLAEVLEVGPDEIRQRAYLDYKDWLAWASDSRGLRECQDSGRCSQPRSGRSVRGQRGPRAADEGLPGPVTPSVGLL